MYCDIPNTADTYNKACPVAKTEVPPHIKDELALIQRDNAPDSQAASAESRPPILPLSTYSSLDHQGMHVAFLRFVGADIPHFSSVGTPIFPSVALKNAAREIWFLDVDAVHRLNASLWLKAHFNLNFFLESGLNFLCSACISVAPYLVFQQDSTHQTRYHSTHFYFEYPFGSDARWYCAVAL